MLHRGGQAYYSCEGMAAMAIQVPDAIDEDKAVVRTDLTRARFEDYLRRRAEWARRMRALLDEEEALDALERSLIDALAPGLTADPAVSRERPSGDGSFSEVVHAYERRLIEQALEACHGVQRDAAMLLGMSPTTLNEKLKRLGLRAGRNHF